MLGQGVVNIVSSLQILGKIELWQLIAMLHIFYGTDSVVEQITSVHSHISIKLNAILVYTSVFVCKYSVTQADYFFKHKYLLHQQ